MSKNEITEIHQISAELPRFKMMTPIDRTLCEIYLESNIDHSFFTGIYKSGLILMNELSGRGKLTSHYIGNAYTPIDICIELKLRKMRIKDSQLITNQDVLHVLKTHFPFFKHSLQNFQIKVILIKFSSVKYLHLLTDYERMDFVYKLKTLAKTVYKGDCDLSIFEAFYIFKRCLKYAITTGRTEFSCESKEHIEAIITIYSNISLCQFKYANRCNSFVFEESKYTDNPKQLIEDCKPSSETRQIFLKCYNNCKIVTSYNPNHIKCLYRCGVCLLRMSRPEEAVELLKLASKLDQSDRLINLALKEAKMVNNYNNKKLSSALQQL